MPNIYGNVFIYLGVRNGQIQKDLAFQKALQVRCLRVCDLGMPQALSVGWEKAQEDEREGG